MHPLSCSSPGGIRLASGVPMHRQTATIFLVAALGGLVACGRSPSAPTASTSLSIDAAAEATVNATVQEALLQTAAPVVTLAPDTPFSSVFTHACPDGGSITTTVSLPSPIAGGPVPSSFTMNSRTEFKDCRSQNITMRGDPALVYSSEYKTSAAAPGAPTVVTATTQTTGGLLITSNGVESRVRYNCESLMVIQLGSTSLPQISSTGTVTWESPVGTVTRTTGCGPSR